MQNKYHFDIGLTSYCDFTCQTCVNSTLEKQHFPQELLGYLEKFLLKNSKYLELITPNGIGNIFLYPHYKEFFDFFIEHKESFEKKMLISSKFHFFDPKYLLKLTQSLVLNNISIGLFNKEELDKIPAYKDRILVHNILKYKNILPLSLEVAGLQMESEKKYWETFAQKLGLEVFFERLYNWGNELDIASGGVISQVEHNHCYDYFSFYMDAYGDIHTCLLLSNKKEDTIIGNIKDLYNCELPEIETMIVQKMEQSDFQKDCDTCTLNTNCKLYKEYKS